MINYLNKLVKENNRVIVPGFGAFIISNENGHTVLFNNFLSFNDGLLVNHIVEAEGLEPAAALTKVNDFVTSIKSTLDESRQYILTGLGRFTMDESGILKFHQESAETASEASIVKAKNKDLKITKDLLDIVSNAEVGSENIGSGSEVIITPAILKNEKLLQIDNQTTHEPERPLVTPPIRKPEPIKAKIPVKPAAKAAPVSEAKARKGNSLALFLLLFIFLPLLIGVVYYSFFRNKPAQNVEPIVVTEPVREVIPPAPVQPVIAVPLMKREYHIISGSFAQSALANEMVNELQKKGLDKAKIIERGGKYLVSVDVRGDLISAEARQEVIVNKYRIENYIITIRN